MNCFSCETDVTILFYTIYKLNALTAQILTERRYFLNSKSFLSICNKNCQICKAYFSEFPETENLLIPSCIILVSLIILFWFPFGKMSF